MSAGASRDLVAVHERLRAILAPYRAGLHVAADGPGGMTLELPGYEGQPWGYVAGTRVGKRYVSFYLMAVYGDPALDASISDELRRRKQGKSCFNFTWIDEPLFAELAALTEASVARQPGLVEAARAARPRRRRAQPARNSCRRGPRAIPIIQQPRCSYPTSRVRSGSGSSSFASKPRSTALP